MKYFKPLSPSKLEFVKNKLLSLQARFNFGFPELYSAFILNYEVGKYVEKWDAYLDQYLRPTPKNYISVQTLVGQVSYNWLSSLNQIEHDLKYYPRALDLLNEDNLLRIGDIVETGGLFLGVGTNNQDNIYKYIYDRDRSPVFICNSFDLFSESIELQVKGEEADYQMIEGHRYQRKAGVNFVHSNLLDSLDVSVFLKSERVSSEFFIKGIIAEISHVQR